MYKVNLKHSKSIWSDYYRDIGPNYDKISFNNLSESNDHSSSITKYVLIELKIKALQLTTLIWILSGRHQLW